MATARAPVRSHFLRCGDGSVESQSEFISLGQKGTGALWKCAGAIGDKSEGYWPTFGPESLLFRGPAFGVAAYGKTRL